MFVLSMSPRGDEMPPCRAATCAMRVCVTAVSAAPGLLRRGRIRCCYQGLRTRSERLERDPKILPPPPGWQGRHALVRLQLAQGRRSRQTFSTNTCGPALTRSVGLSTGANRPRLAKLAFSSARFSQTSSSRAPKHSPQPTTRHHHGPKRKTPSRWRFCKRQRFQR